MSWRTTCEHSLERHYCGCSLSVVELERLQKLADIDGPSFSGVDYETGLEVVEAMKALVPAGATLAQLALRWILMHDGVTTAIPGAKTSEQAQANAAAADLPPLDEATLERIRELYDKRIRPLVHQRW